MKCVSIALIGFLAAIFVCPALAAAQSLLEKPESHCSSEVPSTPVEIPMMLCCCDQEALPIAAVHAPDGGSAVLVLNRMVSFKPQRLIHKADPLPDQTGDHLSKLSTLRL